MKTAGEVITTEGLSNLDLVPMLIDATIRCAEAHGTDEAVEGLPWIVRSSVVDKILIIQKTPKAQTRGSGNFEVDVWYDGEKVFSVSWNSSSLKDYELVSLSRGPWMPELLSVPA